MDPLISLELRWFLDGEILPHLSTWFHEHLPGNHVGPPEKRDDVYLYLPKVEDIGVKLRQGKLEIKWRQLARPYRGPHGAAGQVERWIKWDWNDPEGAPLQNIKTFQSPLGPWIIVEKSRWQRKYLWASGNFRPAPKSDRLKSGAAVEIAGLKLHGNSYTTMLIETFAPDQRAQEEILDAAVAYFLHHLPMPLPASWESYGYPQWLGKREVSA